MQKEKEQKKSAMREFEKEKAKLSKDLASAKEELAIARRHTKTEQTGEGVHAGEQGDKIGSKGSKGLAARELKREQRERELRELRKVDDAQRGEGSGQIAQSPDEEDLT